MKTKSSRPKAVVSYGAITEDLAPFPPITAKKLPPGVREAVALKALLALVGPSCPMLVHLPDYGMGLEQIRNFLSAFAGHRLELPPRRTLLRAWESMQAWMEVTTRLAHGEDEATAVMTVANRLGATDKRVRDGVAEFGAYVKAVGPFARTKAGT